MLMLSNRLCDIDFATQLNKSEPLTKISGTKMALRKKQLRQVLTKRPKPQAKKKYSRVSRSEAALPSRPAQARSKDAPKLTDETALNVSLLRAREAIMAHMRPILRAHGFTEQQMRVLRSLSKTVPVDKTSLSERAMLLMPSLLRILRDLEQMGLIKSIPSPHNPRLSRILLSTKGEVAFERMMSEISAMRKIIREQIGSEDVELLLSLLHSVERRLADLSNDRNLI
jgi:homoprotocatechuate degradation regulator HpaR